MVSPSDRRPTGQHHEHNHSGQDEDALGVQSSLLMLGAVCQGRIASLTGLANLFDADPNSVNPCSDPEDDGAILSTGLTLLRGEAQSNGNPGIASLSQRGQAWDSTPAGTDPATGCMGMGLPEVRQGASPITFILRAGGDARESYDAVVDDELTPVREALQVTSLATAGAISAASLIPWSDPSRQALAKSPNERRRFALIGVGGFDSAETAYAKIRAGASAVQLYTALVYGGLSLVPDIVRGLDALLARDGFGSVAEAVGADAA